MLFYEEEAGVRKDPLRPSTRGSNLICFDVFIAPQEHDQLQADGVVLEI